MDKRVTDIQTISSFNAPRVSDEDRDISIGERLSTTDQYGYSGGDAFEDEKAETTYVNRIRFYWEKNRKILKAMTVYYGDGSSVTHGDKSMGTIKDYLVHFGGKRLRQIEVFLNENDHAGRVGALTFVFADAESQTVGVSDGQTKEIIDPDFKFRLRGVVGRTGKDLDKIGFRIGELPVRYEIDSDVDDWSLDEPDVEDVTSIVAEFDNCGGLSETYMEASYEHDWFEETNYVGGFRIMAGVEVTMKVGFPKLIEGTWKVGMEVETDHHWGNTTHKQKIFAFLFAKTVPPMTKTKCKITSTSGTVNATGVVQVTAHFQDGSKTEHPSEEMTVLDSNQYTISAKMEDEICPS